MVIRWFEPDREAVPDSVEFWNVPVLRCERLQRLHEGRVGEQVVRGEGERTDPLHHPLDAGRFRRRLLEGAGVDLDAGARGDGDVRLQGGDDLGDVPDVGGAAVPVRRRAALRKPEQRQRAPVGAGQDGIHPHRRKGIRPLLHFEPATGGRRRPGGARLHARDRVAHLGERLAPHVEVRLRPLGDDIRSAPPFGDDAVNAHGVRKLLAQRGDAVEEEKDAVERVDPVLRVRRRVRRPAVVREVQPGQREVPLRHVPAGGRVDHHRRVDVPEDPLLDHPGLAVPRLLGGRPEGDHLPRAEDAFPELRQRGGRARRRHPHDVVSARVPQPGKRVHLAQERDGGTPFPEGKLRPEGRLHPGHAALHAKPPPGEEPGEGFGGAGLFQGKFGERRDLAQHAGGPRGQPVGDLQDFSSRGIHGRSRFPAEQKRMISQPGGGHAPPKRLAFPPPIFYRAPIP